MAIETYQNRLFSHRKVVDSAYENNELDHVTINAGSYKDVVYRNVEFSNVDMSGCTFAEVNLSGARLTDVNLSNVTIERADVRGLVINGKNIDELLGGS